jgi:hypothetical protein
VQQGEPMNDSEYDQVITTLKEFLQYLEQKNIINPQALQDEEDVNKLIQDIMKLDMKKFAPKREESP